MDMGKKGILGLFFRLSWTVFSFFLCISIVQAGMLNAPEPHPPTIRQVIPSRTIPVPQAGSAAPEQEWPYHKTDDNQHPDGNEQQLMWLMNRARANPSREGAWLAVTGDPMVEGAIEFWHVDLDLMQVDFNSYPPKPPAAFDVRLYNAAKAHCEDLIVRDAQDHLGQFSLIRDAGFIYEYARGIVYSYAKSALYGHAGFNIDWGPDGDGDPNSGPGVQPDLGHRLAIMSLDNPNTADVVEDSDTNVGLAVVPSTNPDPDLGPLVITGDFCKARVSATDHYNRFLVGTVWQDTNGNDQYDPGEGMGSITVRPDHGTYYAVTSDSGGYAIPITADGLYDVSFHGPGIEPEVNLPADVTGQSVLLDLLYVSLPQVITEDATAISSNAAILNGSVVPHRQAASWHFQYGLTDAYGSNTPTDTISVESGVTASIAGLAEDTVYHFRLVASNLQGTSYGDDRTFQTSTSLPSPPQAITGDASNITTDAANLNGSVATHGLQTDYYFQYGTTTAYGFTTDTSSVSVDGAVAVAIGGLAEDSVYHFRLVAGNATDTSYGVDQTFRTNKTPPPVPPQAMTGDASGLTTNTANLNGSVVTNGQATDYYFQYGTTETYGNDTPPASVSVDTDVAAAITGLDENTVYHFRLVASNAVDNSYGADHTFQTDIVTPADQPTNPPSSGGSGGGGGGGCFILTAAGDP